MTKITRIAYNSAKWQRPTGEAKQAEKSDTYNQAHGFGHEEWLFRSEWLIAGWRYAFIQGFHKSHAKLVQAGQAVDVTVFTIEPDRKRRYVASIRSVECLSSSQAADALKEFNLRGWFDVMQQEVIAAGGDSSALLTAKSDEDVLNVRFRLENVSQFPAETYAVAGDPVLRFTRYQLYDAPTNTTTPSPTGSSELPAGKSFQRSAVASVECTPEHARMQAKLMQELKAEYPQAQVVREQDFIDVIVRTETHLILFEIKSDLEPRTVIRQALGQILEYAFYPGRQHGLPVKLVIVGRRALSTDDDSYLSQLRKGFSLPIEYRVVSVYQ